MLCTVEVLLGAWRHLLALAAGEGTNGPRLHARAAPGVL